MRVWSKLFQLPLAGSDTQTWLVNELKGQRKPNAQKIWLKIKGAFVAFNGFNFATLKLQNVAQYEMVQDTTRVQLHSFVDQNFGIVQVPGKWDNNVTLCQRHGRTSPQATIAPEILQRDGQVQQDVWIGRLDRQRLPKTLDRLENIPSRTPGVSKLAPVKHR